MTPRIGIGTDREVTKDSHPQWLPGCSDCIFEDYLRNFHLFFPLKQAPKIGTERPLGKMAATRHIFWVHNLLVFTQYSSKRPKICLFNPSKSALSFPACILISLLAVHVWLCGLTDVLKQGNNCCGSAHDMLFFHRLLSTCSPYCFR